MLRQAVVAGQARGTSGLAIVVTRGVAAWLRVVQEIMIASGHQPSGRSSRVGCVAEVIAGDEIVQLLANMVSHSWEVAYAH